MADGSEDKGLNCCLGRGNGNHIRLPGSPCPPASPSGQAVKHPLDPDTGDKTELQMAPVGSEVPVSHGPGALAWEIHHHLPHPQIHHHRPWAQSPAEQDGWVGGPVHDSQGCDGMGWDGTDSSQDQAAQAHACLIPPAPPSIISHVPSSHSTGPTGGTGKQVKAWASPSTADGTRSFAGEPTAPRDCPRSVINLVLMNLLTCTCRITPCSWKGASGKRPRAGAEPCHDPLLNPTFCSQPSHTQSSPGCQPHCTTAPRGG